jgi:hypothetical protein
MSLDIWLSIKVDTGGDEPYDLELFSGNITHNLTLMASKAGIYDSLWHPYNLTDDGSFPHARELIVPLEKGLKKLKEDPDHYRRFNSSNGWGVYEDFVPFVERVLNSCKEHPKAIVRNSI